MIYTYSLDENDYLTYMLYSTSKSKRVQKRRALNKLILMMVYVLTGLFLYSRNGPVASAVFYILCIPLYFLYNSFEKKQYLKHFKKFIHTHFQENLGRPSSIEFEENHLRAVDDEENRYGYADIEWISETTT